MAPKQKAVSELGTVVYNGNGWRARVKFDRDLVAAGPTHYGPAARRKAEADLVHARRASTRDEMQRVLRNLKDASGPKAAPFAEPLPQPGQTHPCGGPRPDGDIGASHSAAGARADKQFVSSSSSAPNAVEQPAAKRARPATADPGSASCLAKPIESAVGAAAAVRDAVANPGIAAEEDLWGFPGAELPAHGEQAGAGAGKE